MHSRRYWRASFCSSWCFWRRSWFRRWAAFPTSGPWSGIIAMGGLTIFGRVGCSATGKKVHSVTIVAVIGVGTFLFDTMLKELIPWLFNDFRRNLFFGAVRHEGCGSNCRHDGRCWGLISVWISNWGPAACFVQTVYYVGESVWFWTDREVFRLLCG